MSMTKKDFIELADDIRFAEKHDGITFTPEQLRVIMGFCKHQNYAFKEGRWLAYLKGECGPNGGEIKKA